MMSKTTANSKPEVRACAVPMVLEHEGDHPSRWAAIVSIAAKIGWAPQTLHEWVKKAKADSGMRAGAPPAERSRIGVQLIRVRNNIDFRSLCRAQIKGSSPTSGNVLNNIRNIGFGFDAIDIGSSDNGLDHSNALTAALSCNTYPVGRLDRDGMDCAVGGLL